MLFGKEWFNQEIKRTEVGIDLPFFKLFKTQASMIDWGHLLDEQGNWVNRQEYCDQLLQEEKFHDVFLIINQMKTDIPYYEYSIIAHMFLDYLYYLPQKIQQKHQLDEQKIKNYSRELEKLTKINDKKDQ